MSSVDFRDGLVVSAHWLLVYLMLVPSWESWEVD